MLYVSLLRLSHTIHEYGFLEQAKVCCVTVRGEARLVTGKARGRPSTAVAYCETAIPRIVSTESSSSLILAMQN